jgi:hypothetical protein
MDVAQNAASNAAKPCTRQSARDIAEPSRRTESGVTRFRETWHPMRNRRSEVSVVRPRCRGVCLGVPAIVFSHDKKSNGHFVPFDRHRNVPRV